MLEVNKIYHGDCLGILKDMDSESVHCCVTSPPYYGLRDYGNQEQIGLEKTPEEYVSKMVEVFSEVKRVLRKDGTLWLNLGDSYAGSGRGPSNSISQPYQNMSNTQKAFKSDNLKPKDLIGIPWMVAKALRDPLYTGKIKDEKDRVWLAAMVDAEGSICGHEYENNGRQKTNLYISITNSNTHIIEKCDLVFPQHVKHTYLKSDKKNLDVYRWDVEQMEMKQLFIQEIYPYLIAKRKQAIMGYTFIQFQMELLSKKKGYLPEQQEKRSWLIQSLSKLNHGQDVDLPDWVQEPPSLHEPGFYLRQDIIWHKPNPMPESVTDRCTKAHEYIFLLTKSAKYYYDADSIKTPITESSLEGLSQNIEMQLGSDRVPGKTNGRMKAVRPHGIVRDRLLDYDSKEKELRVNSIRGEFESEKDLPITDSMANKRSVWTVNTMPYSEAHFATFPERLIVDCIKAGCQVDGIVLDPFMGAGTTGLVARKLDRNFIGIELNEDYIKIANRRLKKELGIFL